MIVKNSIRTLQSYFDEWYVSDYEYAKKEWAVDCLCARSAYILFKEGSDQKMHDLKLFVLFSYELNNYAQAIFTYFPDDYKEFRTKYPPVFLPGCIYSFNKNIIAGFHKESLKFGPEKLFNPTSEELTNVHDFVSNFVQKYFQTNTFKKLNYDLLKYCMKKDWDCHTPKMTEYEIKSFPKEEQKKLQEFIKAS